jgi:D-lyxose ketol-isomerase
MKSTTPARDRALNLLKKAHFPITAAEEAAFQCNDFGIGDFEREGFTFVDLLRTPRVRITLMVLLPNQCLPEHMHPAYDNEPGKEETLRVIWGSASVFMPAGPEDAPSEPQFPKGRDAYYSVTKEHKIKTAEYCTIPPLTRHWFKGGPEGAVVMAFQNRVDETKNIFTDPASTGCPIKADAK